MKKSMLFAAAAVVAMASCTNEDFTGFQQGQNGESAINFGSGTKKLTRGDKLTDVAAADALDNNFVVLGYKGDGALSTSSTKVFDYYNVNFDEGSAGSTESNSSNWEYVAQEVNGLSSVTSQTIKYWDFAKSQYDFIAFSKGIQSTSSKTIDQLFTAVDLANLDTKAYTVTGTLDELKECYIADLLTVYNTSENVANQPSFPNGPVTPVFRKLQSKIRLAFYETIPGYSVKDVKFYESTTATSAATKPTVFAADKTLAVSGDTEATMEISFPTIGQANVGEEDYNQAAIKFTTLSGTGDLSSTVTFDDLTYTSKDLDEKSTGNIWLGRSSNTATYAGENDESNDYAYQTVLPVDKGSVLNIKVDYTLESIDGSGEEITVHGATAQVPAIYTAWQPNYAYTYIFKISDQTNGKTNTGQDYVGLYPITFDAVVEGDIDGIQETITEVGKPSITTYQQGKVVTDNDEYVSGKPIYVTVDNGKVLTTDAWKLGATNIFIATLGDENPCQTLSEKAVANCFNATAFNPTGVSDEYTVKDVNKQILKLTKATDWTLETSIAQADAPHGVVIKTDGDKTCVAKIANPTAGTTYVFQYLQTPATYKAPSYNTVAPSGASPYYAWDATNLVFEEVVADGTETRTDLYSSKTDAVFCTSANDGLDFNTLAKGTEFYVYDSTAKTYTKKIANGTETENATYFTATFTKATGTINANDMYYEKLGNSEVYVEKTASSAISVLASDPYYTVTSTVIPIASYHTLATGMSSYWTAETNGNKVTYTLGKAAGDEIFVDNKFVKTLPSVSNPVQTNTLPTGLKYYTGTTNDGTGTAAPAEVTASGSEKESDLSDAKVVDAMPEYYYKVIRVK